MALTAGPRLGLGSDPTATFKVWAQYDGASAVVVEYKVFGAATWIVGPSGTADVSKSNSIVLEVTGLDANTKYDYRLVENTVADTAYWTRTFPASGRFLYYQLSDAHNDPSQFDQILTDYATFDSLGLAAIATQGGDFYTNAGDLATTATRVAKYLTSLALTTAFKYIPVMFMWDDHDFAGNNSSLDFQPQVADSTVPAAVWDHIWRDTPTTLTDTKAYTFQIASIPWIMLDNRSQRASQTGIIPSLLGNESTSTRATVLGTEQRAWAITQLQTYNLRGLVFLATGSQFIDNSATHTGGTEKGNRDSFGIFYKSERNELMLEAIRYGYGVRGNLFVLVGDDHRNVLWTNMDYASDPRPAIFTEPATPAQSAGLGMRSNVIGVMSGTDDEAPFGRQYFGTANRYDNLADASQGRVVRWDITSARAGEKVTARFTFINLSTGAAAEVDDTARVGDFYFANGQVTTYDATLSGVFADPENAPRSGIRFQRSYRDEITGFLVNERDTIRDRDGRLREFADVDRPSPDTLREDFITPSEIDDALDPLE